RNVTGVQTCALPIFGLHMVFLDTVLAIDTDFNDVCLNKKKMKAFQAIPDMTVYLPGNKKTSVGKMIYHRSPRNYEHVLEDCIERSEERRVGKEVNLS